MFLKKNEFHKQDYDYSMIYGFTFLDKICFFLFFIFIILALSIHPYFLFIVLLIQIVGILSSLYYQYFSKRWDKKNETKN